MLNRVRVARGITNLIGKTPSGACAPSITIAQRGFRIDEIGNRFKKPFDYKTTQYKIYHQLYDSTMERLGENSLIITVEGNFGSGKSEYAKKLAASLDFVHVSEPDLDKHWYCQDGLNTRERINDLVDNHKRFRLDSLEDWHLEPTFKRGILMQHLHYLIRWMQTRTALIHLFSTGQGVVLERSAFSDSIIAQSLFDHGFLSNDAWKFYIKELVPSTLLELWKPHVMIYLNKSPEECYKTIQEKGKPFEKNSKVYSKELLKTVEKHYQKSFLPDMRNRLHLLTYESKDANIERTLEDMEMLDFEDLHKFSDWRVRKEVTLDTYRAQLADLRYCDALLSSSGFINVPEYMLYGEEMRKLQQKIAEDPKNPPRKLGLFTNYFYKHQESNWF